MRISTRYVGPTDNKGSRVIAFAQGKQKSMPWNYKVSIQSNHKMIALRLFRLLTNHNENEFFEKELSVEVLASTKSLRGYHININ